MKSKVLATILTKLSSKLDEKAKCRQYLVSDSEESDCRKLVNCYCDTEPTACDHI